MRKIHTILTFIAILSTQQVFADDTSGMPTDKPCATIAKACWAAGFVRTKLTNKGFWKDCMKPVILGQTVSGVTIDSATVKSCRVNKINELKMELKEFQKAN